MQPTPEPRIVDVAGTPTAVVEIGDGPPALLLHGSGPGSSGWPGWIGVAPALAARFRLVIPDQLGFGRTPGPGGPPGREGFTHHAFGVMDALRIERFAVVGHSMGGGVALSMAVARPRAVTRLACIGTMGADSGLPPALDELWGYEPDRERMRRLMERVVFDKALVTGEMLEWRLAATSDPDSAAAYARLFPAPRERWVRDFVLADEELERIGCPLLLVHGREDELIPFERSSLVLMQKLGDVRLHVLGRCGHSPPVERPAELAELLLAFLGAGETDSGQAPG